MVRFSVCSSFTLLRMLAELPAGQFWQNLGIFVLGTFLTRSFRATMAGL